MAQLELATPLRRTRRHERGRHGRDVDLRRSLRACAAHRRRAAARSHGGSGGSGRGGS